MLLLIIFSFLAGFVTIFSPCILSIAPILFTAGSNGNHKKPLGIVTGLIISFSFFTLTLSSIVQATGISPDIFRYVAVVVVIFFGLTMIIPSFERAFTRVTQYIARAGNFVQEHSIAAHTHFISGFVLGIALGLLWTPCAGPILATITTLAAAGNTTLFTILITLAYTTGAAIPMLLFCFGGTKIMQSMTSVAPYTHAIRKIFGTIAIVSAIGILFNVDTVIEEKIAHWFPTITLEQNVLLEKELNTLRKSQGISPMMEAPEIVGIDRWLNSEPLTLAQLKGSVVLIDFWTYSCINCIRTLPHVQGWYDAYKNNGFTIIGIHTPEFAFEKSIDNVESALKRFGITYPIALDNNYKTWQAYNNHYWPAHYLIDQSGTIVKTHFGEGNYVEMEDAIRALLNMPPCKKTDEIPCATPLTPETYLGFARANSYQSSLRIQKNKPASYSITETLGDNQIGLEGAWEITSEFITSMSDTSLLQLNFVANNVYLVMQADSPTPVTVLLDGKPVPKNYYTQDFDKNGNVVVYQARAYHVLDLKKDHGRHVLTLQCPHGIHAYVFTFGGENRN